MEPFQTARPNPDHPADSQIPTMLTRASVPRSGQSAVVGTDWILCRPRKRRRTEVGPDIRDELILLVLKIVGIGLCYLSQMPVPIAGL
jgi:hypothetical protein